ncbi:MAG: carbon-nitrogen hydrolase family protein [Rhodospirillales bacterium]|nr:carbon-nitrogen hydrolase family protein [Rhodospirillales bacterium]
MTPFSIAGVQMNVAVDHENVTAMAHKIDLAMIRFPWVQMVLFSELAPYGPVPENHPASYEEMLHLLCEKARQHNIWLIPGSMFVHEHGALFNEAVVINPAGEVIARYRKMFPFAPYEHGVTGGSECLVFDVPGVGRFGLSICYDIWFPETMRQITAMGAEVLLHPVLTGTTDRDIEISIAQATAAMFQCYIFDINGLGSGGTGRSCVVDPVGNLVYQAAGQEEIIPIEVDFDMVRRQRVTGHRSLGQTLKSFRDRNCAFPVYNETFDTGYLNSLGALEMPQQGSRDGVHMAPPEAVLPLDHTSPAGEIIDIAKPTAEAGGK